MSEDNIQLPDYLCFKPSKTKIGHNGLFTTRRLEANEPLGIYRGKVRRILPQTADEEYVWAVLSARGVPVFYIDASNPNDGNFLRFIRWTHEKSQQNVVCMQQNQQIHYFTNQIIEPDEELLTYIERQKSKKKEKRENGRTRRETRQQQSTQHQDNPAIKILEFEPGSDLVDDDNVHLVMNNRSLEFELQITKKFLSETFISDGVKQTCLKCDICHQIFMSNVAFKFHYHTYHITPQYLSPANRPRTKIRDHCNICRFTSIANDVKSVVVDLLEVVAGGQRLEENRYVRLHIYRCHWCAPIDAHYNTAKQLSQHVRSKHYRLLQALLATQANMLQNGGHVSRSKRSRETEDDENHPNSPSNSNAERPRHRSSNALQSNSNQDVSARLPIPIGLPDPLTDRDCQHLYTIGEHVAYNINNCIDGTLEDLKQNETFCRQQMDDEDTPHQLTSIEHFLTQYPLARELLGPRRRHDNVIQHLADDYFDHPKNQDIDMSKFYQRQKSIPERRFIMNRYSCVLCPERFATPAELIEHEKLVHDKTISYYDWAWNSIGLLQSNPYGFILELETELKQQQQRTKTDSPSLFMTNNNLKKKTMRQRSTSSSERASIVQPEDVKPTISRTPSKRVKRDIQRANTCPNLESSSPPEKEEVPSTQRKSKRLRKSMKPSPDTSPVRNTEQVQPKKELISSMKRPISSAHSSKQDHANQIIVKTDNRYYWCTKCSKVYLNLISLYTESHYRQCVGENQHFNVTEDRAFFNEEEVRRQLPSSAGSNTETKASATAANSTDHSEETPNPTRRKETIFFSKTSDESRTYFINGKPIRMSSINRPLTVKDLRQQFHQQSTTTTTTNANASEEYIYQQRGTSKARRTAESNMKTLPAPRSLDRFGISSDEDEDQQEDLVEIKPPIKTEVEKTLVKRRLDSDYASSIETDEHQGNKRKTSSTRSSYGTTASTSMKRSISQPQGSKSSSGLRPSWKVKTEEDSPSESSESTRSHVPESLKDYDHVCSKCNMPFASQSALDEHQNGQCLEMNVLDPSGSWFRCPLCALTYCDANLMSLHINKTHRDVLRNNQRAHAAQRRSNSRQFLSSRSTPSNETHHPRKYS